MFHDFPIDYGNIDHVLVGPPGVFTIETKYRRKMKGEEEGHKIRFDERVVRFPESESAKPIEQAKLQAKELGKLLEKIFGTLKVTPVVVYPGWWVTREAREVSVQVMNDKQVIGWLPQEKRVLDDETIRKVAAFLDEKCRDVEV